MDSPLLLHIPHASAYIPAEYKNSFQCDLAGELQLMTDSYTNELFDLPVNKLIFPVSRLVCDVERFRDDRKEKMAARGMGACYTHGHDNNVIRSLTEREREEILCRWYDPHHTRFSEMTAGIAERFGICYIVDCHSFSSVPLPYEPDQDPDRPDICIGTDPFHTDPELIERVAKPFRERGYSIAIDTPYSGTIVPMCFYHRSKQVRSVMIEVNRGLYQDAHGKKLASFQKVKKDIAAVIRNIPKTKT